MHAHDFAKVWSKLTKDYRNVMDEALAPSLTDSQLIVLEKVAEHKRLKPSALIPYLETTAAAVTTLLDRMEKNALISRERDQEDRRIVWVSLTSFGEQEMNRGLAARESYWNELLNRISAHNQQLLLLLLHKLTQSPIDQLTNTTKKQQAELTSVAASSLAESAHHPI
ncbi:MarR family winged helix-turn-helix transcriptional regulator [Paenibacillus arenosi]|uniref:MarR family transcriptional regulator n=1 Tax=Paenibacillus arenosi TaxID=2774142 RepID=A0ABR9AU40_9BACL|nr:MarR family transcriptional regulator [Paenibacillus arenosi]MBD8497532.1 MarR family transcriptional regulator [Paenibacillus arenosi]